MPGVLWVAAQIQRPVLDRGTELLQHPQGFFVLDKALQLSSGAEVLSFARVLLDKHANILLDKWFLRLVSKVVDRLVSAPPPPPPMLSSCLAVAAGHCFSRCLTAMPRHSLAGHCLLLLQYMMLREACSALGAQPMPMSQRICLVDCQDGPGNGRGMPECLTECMLARPGVQSLSTCLLYLDSHLPQLPLSEHTLHMGTCPLTINANPRAG